MTRSSIASVVLAAASVVLAVGACNREGPATPSGHVDATLLKQVLGSASAIPLQQCEHAAAAQPLRMAAGGGQPQPSSTFVPLPSWLHLAALRKRGIVCKTPPYTQQDNAVPLTRANPAVQF